MNADELEKLVTEATKEKANLDQAMEQTAKMLIAAREKFGCLDQFIKAGHDHLRQAHECSKALAGLFATLTSKVATMAENEGKEALKSYFRIRVGNPGLFAKLHPNEPRRAYVAYDQSSSNRCYFRPFQTPGPLSVAYPSQLETLAVAMLVGFTVASIHGKRHQRWVKLNEKVFRKLTPEQVDQCYQWADEWQNWYRTSPVSNQKPVRETQPQEDAQAAGS